MLTTSSEKAKWLKPTLSKLATSWMLINASPTLNPKCIVLTEVIVYQNRTYITRLTTQLQGLTRLIQKIPSVHQPNLSPKASGSVNFAQPACLLIRRPQAWEHRPHMVMGTSRITNRQQQPHQLAMQEKNDKVPFITHNRRPCLTSTPEVVKQYDRNLDAETAPLTRN